MNLPDDCICAPAVAEQTALLAWFDARTVWWVRWNPDMQGTIDVDRAATRMALGDSHVGVSRLAQVRIAQREVTFDWVEQ